MKKSRQTYWTSEQKLNDSIKKYIKLERKKNDIENQLSDISRNIQKYKNDIQNTQDIGLEEGQ